ncbi:MAG: MBL fold metallo-hydrolase [Thermonemataceae bacterium]
MQLYTIETGFFKLDGGAMFGVVPKTLWEKKVPADAHNRCTWAMRCLLIEEGDQLILIDCGIGDKQDDKFFSHYDLHGEASLLSSIKQAGFSPSEITDVILTHLHFDHCGGAVQRQGDQLTLTFPNARYWSNETHWQWAKQPNPREKASFLQENILPIEESGHLHFIEQEQPSPFAHIDFIFVDGHTEQQMLPRIRYKEKYNLLYCADLIPSAAHIGIPYVMSYDVRPLLTMQEKQKVLQMAYDQGATLFFEHDENIISANLKMTEKGIRLNEVTATT